MWKSTTSASTTATPLVSICQYTTWRVPPSVSKNPSSCNPDGSVKPDPLGLVGYNPIVTLPTAPGPSTLSANNAPSGCTAANPQPSVSHVPVMSSNVIVYGATPLSGVTSSVIAVGPSTCAGMS